jgi:hypothetical protein
MNDVERNRTVNWIVTITIGLLVALLVGALFGFLAAKHHFRRPVFAMDMTGKGITGAGNGLQKVAVLTNDNGTCMQTVDNSPDAVVHLSIGNGDTIQWSPPTATTVVKFANVAPNGPFASLSYTGQSGIVGPARNADPGDYYYTNDMRVNGRACNNFQSMGVHIDK